jgi:hypothetical protein
LHPPPIVNQLELGTHGLDPYRQGARNMNEPVRQSAWREFLSSIRHSLVTPAVTSFARAHRVSPPILRILTYPLAALISVLAWLVTLTVLTLILGVMALYTWLSGGYSTGGKDPRQRQAEAREAVRQAKEQRQAGN